MSRNRPDADAGEGTRVTEFSVADEELVVISLPLAAFEVAGALTPAEREVVMGLLEGRSNADIASERGTSQRTVANQIASIFEKVGVRSRAELAARIRGES